MVKRKIPKTELRRHIRETPFTRDEVQRLWNRFNSMDLDGSGLLNYQVCLLSTFELAPVAIPSSTESALEEHATLVRPSVCLQETSKVDELRCNPFSARIVYMFSEDGSGQLTFQKFINMMSVFSSRTSKQTKAVWAFALWDFDGEESNVISSSSCTYFPESTLCRWFSRSD